MPGRGNPLLCLGAVVGQGDALVVDGQVLRLLWRMPRAGEDFAEVQGERRVVQEVGELRELLTRLGRRYHRVLIDWANSPSLGPGSALEWAGATQNTQGKSHSVEQFVHQRLSPRLEAEGFARLPAGEKDGGKLTREDKAKLTGEGKPKLTGDGEAKLTGDGGAKLTGEDDGGETVLMGSGIAAAAEEVAERIAGSEGLQDFALQGDTYCNLVPFYGRARPGQVHIRWRGQELVGVDADPRAQAVARFDRHMSTIAREVFSRFEPESRQWQRREEVLYEDQMHSVVVQAGQVYCCRKIPPYVVEGRDRKLYRFGEVTVGVPIPDVAPTAVLCESTVRVMHEYDHMFVYGGAGACICMPKPAAYYQKLQRQPLEDGIVELLESARLTMCSGYFEGCHAPYRHLSPSLAPRITAAEARKDKLPVYRFYRSSGSHSVMLRWW